MTTWKPSGEQGVPPSHESSVETSWEAKACSQPLSPRRGRPRAGTGELQDCTCPAHPGSALGLVACALCWGHIRWSVSGGGNWLFPLAEGLLCARAQRGQGAFPGHTAAGAALGSDTPDARPLALLSPEPLGPTHPRPAEAQGQAPEPPAQ